MSDNNSFDSIIDKIKNSNSEDKRNIAKELSSKLSDEQQNMLKEALKNKDVLRQLLNSDEAKNIINKLGLDGSDVNGLK